jgi:hypothetical protein
MASSQCPSLHFDKNNNTNESSALRECQVPSQVIAFGLVAAQAVLTAAALQREPEHTV